ncbi:hypothetical protein BH11MYX3_BH11MYX3_16930 [soil metagenome]
MRRAAALALLGACSSRTPIATCADDLAGTWRSEAGEQWMIVDGAALEAYTLFDDTHPVDAPGIEIGPRTIDLSRTPRGADGEVRRRYLRAGAICIAKVPAHLLTCQGDTLELVLADPTAPVVFEPCAWGRPEPSRRERWQRISPTSTTR